VEIEQGHGWVPGTSSTRKIYETLCSKAGSSKWIVFEGKGIGSKDACWYAGSLISVACDTTRSLDALKVIHKERT
jgi:hypothetical protein